MKKTIILFLIVLLAFLVRLYRIDFPLADWHSWRQADTSAVSRNFVKDGIDLLHPRFDDLSNVASGLDNPQGWRMVEFPVYNAITAASVKLFGHFGVETWGRLISVFFSLGSLVLIYKLAKKHLGELSALFSAFFFAFLPFSIYYGRVILPEPSAVFFGLLMLFAWDNFITKKELNGKIIYGLVGLTAGSLAFLLKPYTGVYLLPLVVVALKHYRFNFKKYLLPTALVLLSLVPFYLWRHWIAQYPEGIPAYDWLFNKDNIRFSPYFFYWIFYKRIGQLILGFWGASLLVLGLLYQRKNEGLFLFAFAIGILAYFWIIAGGNVQHDYYQVLSLPVVCLLLGKGAAFLFEGGFKGSSKLVSRLVLILIIALTFSFSWFRVKDYFNINNGAIVMAGRRADQLIPKEAKVIAPYGGDTAFLYQTNRCGWPVGIDIEKMIEKGAQFYVNTNTTDLEVAFVKEKYCLIEETDNFVIVDLTRSCQ